MLGVIIIKNTLERRIFERFMNRMGDRTRQESVEVGLRPDGNSSTMGMIPTQGVEAEK